MSTAETDAGAQSGGALRILRANGPLRALFTARIVSYAGDSLSIVALMLHVANTTGQGIAVALLLLAGDFVPSLFSPIAGAISERFDLKRVMITCEVVQGALMLLIALSLPPLPLLLALVAARSIASHVFMPASRSAIPAMVSVRQLRRRIRPSVSAPTAPKRSGRCWPPRCCRSSASAECCWWTRPRSCSLHWRYSLFARCRLLPMRTPIPLPY